MQKPHASSPADVALPPIPPSLQPAGRRRSAGFLNAVWTATCRRLAPRCLALDRQVLRGCTPPRDVTVDTFGAVAVRRSRGGLAVQTTVKGEPGGALATAMQRLAGYLAGDNRDGRVVRAMAPIVQWAGTPGTWTVQIGLANTDAASGAPSPRSGKLRIVHAPRATIAVICVSGRPSPGVCDRWEQAIRAALEGSEWVADGRAVVHLPRPLGVLPWTGTFEVAIPVAAPPR